MFHKPFRIKSNTATKNSERKRLKREIASHFPDLFQHQLDGLIPNKSTIATVKVLTHGGTNVTVTVVDKEPIMFESEGVLCPTVYTIWRYPTMLQSVTTWPAVIPKLQGGADLMLPGVVTGDQGGCGLEGIVKSQLCGVNTVKNRSVIGVGVALMSHDQMLANGMRGKGIEILHLYEDKLWEMGSKSDPPLIPLELPLLSEVTPTEPQATPSLQNATPTQPQTTPSSQQQSTNEEPVKSKPIVLPTGPLKSSIAGVIQKVGGVRVKKGKKRKPRDKSGEETGAKSGDKLKSKVTSKFSSRSHKRYRNYSLNELAKAEVEVSHHDYSNEEEESSDEYDDEDLSSIGSEDEYLLSTVEDQSVAVGLMPDDNDDFMQFAELFSPEVVVMLKRTTTIYVPIGEKPTNLPKKLNKRFVKSQKEGLKDHGLVKYDESNVDTLQMHAQEVMKSDFEPARGLSSEVVEVLGERKKMIVYVPVFFKTGEPRPETDIANFAIDNEEIESTLTNDINHIFNAVEEAPSSPSKEKVDPSLSVKEVAANALKFAESAKVEDPVPRPALTQAPLTKPPRPPPPAPEDLVPLNSNDPRFLERYGSYKPKSQGYKQAGLLAQKLTILDYVTGEFELQPFRLQRKLRKKYGKKKRPKTPPEPDLSALTSKDFYDLPTITEVEFKKSQTRDYVKVTDIPCVHVDDEIVPLSQVLSDTDYNAEIVGNFTDVEKLVLRALKKIAVLGLVSEDGYSTEGDDVEPIDLVMEQISKLFRERVKSGEGGMVINNEQFHELRERYSKEKLLEDGSNKATGPVLVPGRNYDRSLMNFVTEPIQATTSSAENMTSSTMSSQEGTSSASNVTAPLLAVLSITETIESTKPTTHPESVVASPDVMTSSMKNVSSSTKNVTSLQKKAAAWATMGVENEGDVFTPSLLQNMLMEGISDGGYMTQKSSASPTMDETNEPKEKTKKKKHKKKKSVMPKSEEEVVASSSYPASNIEGEKESHDVEDKSCDQDEDTTADIPSVAWYPLPDGSTIAKPADDITISGASSEDTDDNVVHSKLPKGNPLHFDNPEAKETRDMSLFRSALPDAVVSTVKEKAKQKPAGIAAPHDDGGDDDDDVGSDSLLSSEPNINWYPIPVLSSESTNEIASEDPTPTMDDLLTECFYLAVRTKVNKDELPLLTSTFYRSHMLELCPPSYKLDVKKSSFKKLSKFLQEKQTEGILKIEETAKGVESITSIEFKHPMVKSFTPQFVLPKDEATPTDLPTSKTEASAASGQVVLHIKELHSPSSSMLTFFRRYGYNKDSVLDEKQVREVLTIYVKEMDLVAPDDPREVVLDPILTDCLMSKGERDTFRLNRHELIKRTLSKMKPAYSIARGNGKPIVRRGQLLKVLISLTQRTGNKKATIIDNLSIYHIDPVEVADKLQKIAAASTTVTREPHTNVESVIVQGNACKMVAKLLQEQYGLPLKYMEAVNKLKPLKKKKTGRK